MYTSKIKIDYAPQQINYIEEVKLPERWLTIADISKHLKEGETFGFLQKKDAALGLPIDYIVIYKSRLETDEELKVRIEKAEKYNENYEKFPAKYRNNK